MPGQGMTYGSETANDGSLHEEAASYAEKAPRSRSGSGERQRTTSGESTGAREGGEVQAPYPGLTEAERRQVAEAGMI
jgi:hypothetical protein